MKPIAITAGLALAAALAFPLCADKVTLKDGKPPVQGTVIDENAQDVSLTTVEGAQIKLPSASILTIERYKKPQEYRNAEKAMGERRYADAAAAFEAAAKATNADKWVKPYSLLYAGDAYKLLAQTDKSAAAKAIKDYDDFLAAFPSHRLALSAQLSRVDCKVLAGTADAQKDIDDLKKSGKILGCDLQRLNMISAGLKENQKQYKEAIEDYKSIMMKAPVECSDLADDAVNHAIRCYLAAKDTDGMRDFCQSLLTRSGRPKTVALAYIGLGDYQFQMKNYEEALVQYLHVTVIPEFTDAVDAEDRAKAWFQAGECFAKLTKKDQAKNCYTEAKKSSNTSWATLAQRKLGE